MFKVPQTVSTKHQIPMSYVAQADTIAALGKPSKITDGIQFFDELAAKGFLVEGCTTEYWYEPPYAIQLLSFCFDKGELLLHKYNWVSW